MRRAFGPLLACLAWLPAGLPAHAFEFAGPKTITLKTSDGQDIRVGSVAFSPKDGKTGFKVSIDTSGFKDFFLSMREFKCLEGKEIQCYVPYPYPNAGVVSEGDLRWLETALIFMFKTPSSFGATLANGLVYELKPDGDALVGAPHSVDLNQIAAPPENPDEPPFPPAERQPVEPGARWIASLTIR